MAEKKDTKKGTGKDQPGQKEEKTKGPMFTTESDDAAKNAAVDATTPPPAKKDQVKLETKDDLAQIFRDEYQGGMSIQAIVAKYEKDYHIGELEVTEAVMEMAKGVPTIEEKHDMEARVAWLRQMRDGNTDMSGGVTEGLSEQFLTNPKVDGESEKK